MERTLLPSVDVTEAATVRPLVTGLLLPLVTAAIRPATEAARTAVTGAPRLVTAAIHPVTEVTLRLATEAHVGVAAAVDYSHVCAIAVGDVMGALATGPGMVVTPAATERLQAVAMEQLQAAATARDIAATEALLPGAAPAE